MAIGESSLHLYLLTANPYRIIRGELVKLKIFKLLISAVAFSLLYFRDRYLFIELELLHVSCQVHHRTVSHFHGVE